MRAIRCSARSSFCLFRQWLELLSTLASIGVKYFRSNCWFLEFSESFLCSL